MKKSIIMILCKMAVSCLFFILAPFILLFLYLINRKTNPRPVIYCMGQVAKWTIKIFGFLCEKIMGGR